MRYYTNEDGRQFPSVTTVLDATMGGDRQLRLMNALTHSNGLRRREEGRRRGNSLDAVCKAYLMGGVVPCMEHQHQMFFRKLQPVLDELRQNCDAFDCDRAVFNERDGYAGTIDIIAYRNGEAMVIDLKTKYKAPTPEILADHWLQVIAYGNALHSQGVAIAGIGLIISMTKSCELLTEINPVVLDGYLAAWRDRLTMFLHPSLTEMKEPLEPDWEPMEKRGCDCGVDS
ncbi:MAG: PD-(D/E)XK nuclease family protein [Elainellaceae cyanobacterium]